MASTSLWLPLLWFLLLGSRPLSYWFGADIKLDTPDGYLEGNAFDRNVYLALILIALVLLIRQRIPWQDLCRRNRWFAIFLGFCLVSVLWSDFPYVALKRWVKDAGNVLMVLLITTEKKPAQALQAVFLRYAYVAIPLSVVFIKYFPDIGRYYNSWTWEPAYCGITYEKNTLGPIAAICFLFLVWDLLQRKGAKVELERMDIAARILLLAMGLWLIMKAQSATSLVGLVLGASVLLFMRSSWARAHIDQLGRVVLVLVILFLLAYLIPGVPDMLVGLVGRDITLTGRTELWADLLKQPFNPLLGTGYQSFWLGSRAEALWDKYYFHPNQAHNGYLETYINLGLIGTGLLMAFLVTAFRNLRTGLSLGEDYAILRLSLFSVALFSNWTEATFNRLSLVWIITILAIINHEPACRPEAEAGTNRVKSMHDLLRIRKHSSAILKNGGES